MLRSVIIGLAAAVGFSGVALAASQKATTQDIIESTFAGYVDAHIGLDGGREDYSNSAVKEWRDLYFGGAARGVVRINSALSVQGDVWADHFSGQDPRGVLPPWQNTYPGAGVHVTWHPDDTNEIGALLSLGGYWYSTSGYSESDPAANIAIEGVHSMGPWRFYGQAGLASYTGGPLATTSEHALYSALSVAYFVDPNLMIAGRLEGVYTTATTFSSPELTTTGRIEYKPAGSPVSYYLQATAFSWDDNNNFGPTGRGLEGIVNVGLRVPIGDTTTLQDLVSKVGLVDMNPLYGADSP